MEPRQQRPLPPEARATLEEAALRVRAGASARRLWGRFLTPEDRERLGDLGRALHTCGDAAGIWRRLRSESAERAVVEVAWRLGFLTEQDRGWLVRELGEAADEVAAAVRESVATADLVVVVSQREVYWKGAKLDVPWATHNRLWDYFDELCRAAERGQTLDGLQFNSRGDLGGRYLVIQKSKLKAFPTFPQDLHALIVPAGRGTQRLDLPSERIRIVRAEGEL